MKAIPETKGAKEGKVEAPSKPMSWASHLFSGPPGTQPPAAPAPSRQSAPSRKPQGTEKSGAPQAAESGNAKLVRYHT